MVKLARKHSDDPAQESLRSLKDEWNKQVSLLIAEIIAFKRGINGRGDKNFGIPPSSIKDPLPEEISRHLNQIQNHSQEVLSGALRIKDYQEQYSQNRRKSASLISESSWWGSRLWTRFYLLNKVSKAERKLRLRLLSAGQELKEKSKIIETLLLSKDENSLLDLVNKLNNIIFIFLEDFVLSFQNFQKLLAESAELKQKEQRPKPFAEIFSQKTSINIIVNHLSQLSNVSLEDKQKLNKLYVDFNHQSHKFDLLQTKESSSEEELQKLYQEVYNLFLEIKKISEKYLGPISSFKDTAERIVTASYNSLIKESNSISNFLNKKLLSISPNSSERIKLDILEIVDYFQNNLNKFMDNLEKYPLDNNVFINYNSIIHNLIDIVSKVENLSEITFLTNKSKVINIRDLRKLKDFKYKLQSLTS